MNDDVATFAENIRTYTRGQAVSFRKTNEEFGGLSNMAPGFPLEINGIHILTSEALYQACRFPHRPEVQKVILAQRSPMTAKMKSKPHRDDSRPDWDFARVPIMKWCLRVKLAQNWNSFGTLLLATGDRPIVEDSRKDGYWGAMPIDDDTLSGQNVLGRLLMELREKLKAQPEVLKIVEPPPLPNFLLLGNAIPAITARHTMPLTESLRPDHAPGPPNGEMKQLKTMDLNRLFILIERLRKEAIGEPQWIAESKVYEYHEHSAKVVAVLKLARAAHGISALNLLCQAGLFIDFGVIIRCVNDCVEEAYFLMEEFPKTSTNVDQFVESFFSGTIDDYLSSETSPVPTKKVRSAVVRILKGRHDDATRNLVEKIYKTFCGYVHANYAHVMEVYNGSTSDFNLAGVPSIQQRQMRMEHVELAADSVLHAAAFVAHTLGLEYLHQDIVQSWQ